MLVREGVRIDEDSLTHAVIGLMRYLPPELWLPSFLQQLRSRNPLALGTLETSSNAEVRLWPSYLVPDEWKHKFWRPLRKRGDPEVSKGSINPDAVITTKDWLMFVESELSHDVEAEQLFQQFAIASRERQGKEFFVLLINRALTRPSYCGIDSAKFSKFGLHVGPEDQLEKFIATRCTKSLYLPFTEEDVTRRLLWINWQSFFGLYAQLNRRIDEGAIALPQAFKPTVVIMLRDVCRLLEREDLVPIDFKIAEMLVGLSVDLEAVPQWHNHN